MAVSHKLKISCVTHVFRNTTKAHFDNCKVVLDIPRDRNGIFDPMLIAKYQRRFPEFDRKIISMYAGA